MKHVFKKALALSMALMMVLTVSVFAADVPVISPAPASAISVVLDGKPINFTDVAPELINDRTYVPFRAVFEALGATVDYQNDARTIIAKLDGKTVEFKIGSSEVKVTENGVTTVVKTDAASFIDAKSDRTLVPVRFAAQSLGSTVGWSQNTKTVNIIDGSKLMNTYAGKFSLMDRYLASNAAQSKKTLAFSGTLKMSMQMTQDGQTMPFGVSGTVNGVTSPESVEMAAKLAMDLSALTADMTAEEKAQMEALKNIDANYIINMKTGMMYLNMPMMHTVNPSIPENAWFFIDISEMYRSMLGINLDFAALVNMNTNSAKFADSLQMILPMMADEDDAYENIAEAFKLCEKMFGDNAFTKSGSTYTSSVTTEEQGAKITMKMTLTESGKDITGATMNITASQNGMNMTMESSYNSSKSTAKVTMDVPNMFKLDCNVDMNFSETTKTPAKQPASNVTLINFMDMMNSLNP